MPPQLDLIVSLLDLIAFFLIAPDLIGPELIISLFSKTDRIYIWLRTVAFNRDIAPFNIGYAITALVPVVTVCVLTLLSIKMNDRAVSLIRLAPIGLCAAFIVLYALVIKAAGRVGLWRALSIIGCTSFVTARLIVVVNAWARF